MDFGYVHKPQNTEQQLKKKKKSPEPARLQSEQEYCKDLLNYLKNQLILQSFIFESNIDIATYKLHSCILMIKGLIYSSFLGLYCEQ